MFFTCFFALLKNGRNSTEHHSSSRLSLSEQGHFSEDFLNNVSLDSQLEWFNCFWIHTGGMLCEGQKAVIWTSLPHFCLGGVFHPLGVWALQGGGCAGGAQVLTIAAGREEMLCHLQMLLSSWGILFTSFSPLAASFFFPFLLSEASEFPQKLDNGLRVYFKEQWYVC